MAALGRAPGSTRVRPSRSPRAGHPDPLAAGGSWGGGSGMTLDVFAQDGLSRLVRRAGGQTTCCGFAILAALEHHSDATELVAQYMVNDRARLYLLWLLP